MMDRTSMFYLHRHQNFIKRKKQFLQVFQFHFRHSLAPSKNIPKTLNLSRALKTFSLLLTQLQPLKAHSHKLCLTL